jgi:hypothetical protein
MKTRSGRPTGARELTINRLEKLAKRFVINEDTQCWEWIGYISSEGYARAHLRLEQEKVFIHRFMYELVYGDVPDEMQVDHSCHNKDMACEDGSSCRHRRCVNPSHLQLATPKANTLAGKTPAALNRKKRYCLRGHVFDAENTAIDVRGSRNCRLCARDRTRARRLKIKEMNSNGK